MRIQDEVILALTVWRENRGGGQVGMQSVANVILNRAVRRGTDAYTECVRPLQFTSICPPAQMTAKESEADVWPANGDAQWQQALALAWMASAGTLPDLTQGATVYYDPAGQTWTARFELPNGTSVPFPDGWNAAALKYTGTIAGQLFFVES